MAHAPTDYTTIFKTPYAIGDTPYVVGNTLGTKVNLRAVENGFIITIGCKTFVETSWRPRGIRFVKL